MAYGTEGLSASDVALISDRNNGNGWGDGMGSWWIIIFLIFAFMGWGRNGFGNNGNDGNGFGWSPCCTPATQQGLSDAFNFNQLDNGIRGVQNGLCDGFYAVNSSISSLGATLLQCCCETKTAIMQNGYETRDAINMNANNINSNITCGFSQVQQGLNDLGYRMQDCCCQTNRNIDRISYDMAKNTCDIINAGHADTQRIIDTMTQNTIQELRDKASTYELQLSQQAQSASLIDALRPCPIPAYITCSPYATSFPYGLSGYNGYNNCNCGNCMG